MRLGHRADAARAWPPRPATAVLIVVALTVLTALPWYTAQLMPDIFFPLAVLALHLLAFRRAALRGGRSRH